MNYPIKLKGATSVKEYMAEEECGSWEDHGLPEEGDTEWNEGVEELVAVPFYVHAKVVFERGAKAVLVINDDAEALDLVGCLENSEDKERSGLGFGCGDSEALSRGQKAAMCRRWINKIQLAKPVTLCSNCGQINSVAHHHGYLKCKASS